ncbi:fatty acid desaturas-like protein [Clohesyomyces aquaticus]|uniref:Fatty acid desaturas-like protein n=1 Tax=Clohesyomyces aquaticus TaxID=1231657 RepID=A0A1Y1YZ65_9PLEO|nr:fatty acid desaturas-like protein [Clohesyomyces aquaticus]
MVNLYFQPDAQLTAPDRMVLDVLQRESLQYSGRSLNVTSSAIDQPAAKLTRLDSLSPEGMDTQDHAEQTINCLKRLNDPSSDIFEPTIFVSYDYRDIKNRFLRKYILEPYVRLGRSVVRVDTDVVMFTHLILYMCTSIPSALYLFLCNFSWWHGVLHFIMQIYYMGSYTLMMHQHIHMRGILKPKFVVIDRLFPYITDPLMGHTWNSYYFHHVKHHHVEGNGPEDLSSTVRYQRDDVWNFLHYVGRFYFLIWLDLPRYFLAKKKYGLACKAGSSEMVNYFALYILFRLDPRPTICVFLLPLAIMRLGLMIGNWGQHAFVDDVSPTSDFRSSITLIDVASNRYCFNDGYHTSHHLNPLRHWRDHPVAFLSQHKQYSDEQALVFYNIDYLMITFNLLWKNYMHLAHCLVPIGKQQSNMSIEERAAMLKRKTKRFTEAEIAKKWGKQYARSS